LSFSRASLFVPEHRPFAQDFIAGSAERCLKSQSNGLQPHGVRDASLSTDKKHLTPRGFYIDRSNDQQ